MSEEAIKIPSCWACERPLNSKQAEEALCHGCGYFICGERGCAAEFGEAPWGKHVPDDHIPEEDDEDEEE